MSDDPKGVRLGAGAYMALVLGLTAAMVLVTGLLWPALGPLWAASGGGAAGIVLAAGIKLILMRKR